MKRDQGLRGGNPFITDEKRSMSERMEWTYNIESLSAYSKHP